MRVGLEKEFHLPRLRQDLQLNPGPDDEDGSPTWTLYDAGANKYYKIGWLEFECIVRFSRCATARELVHLVSHETTLRPDEDTVKRIVLFLLGQHLVQANDSALSEYLERESVARELPLWKKALHHYLYFSIPLAKPQKFLEATFPLLRPLFTRQFMTCVLIFLAAGIFLTTRRIDEFYATFMTYLSGEGAVYILVALFFMKIIHEMGHAYTATKYGVPVSTLGVAIVVLYPVLYTETSNAWRMASRRERMHIAMAGVMAETVVASVALMMWHVLPPGIGKSIAFILAAVSLAASLAVNLNPLMRFDGYYIFSDLVGIDNLQERACAFARWRIRRIIWGWDDPKPEVASDKRQRLLEVFGFALLTYRFILFSGIAVLVYRIFFKPLGLFLMLVEVGFFVALPIWRELMVWWRNKRRIFTSPRGVAFLVLLLGGIFFLFLPSQDSVEIPAVLHAQNYSRIFPPAAGRVDEISVSAGQHVNAGDVLFRISSPSLEHDINAARLKVRALKEIKGRQEANLSLTNKWLTRDEDISTEEQKLSGLLKQEDKLIVRAAFSGTVQDIDHSLHTGQWVAASHLLAVLADTQTLILSGYVDEEDHGRITEGASGYFYPEASPLARYPVALIQVETTNSTEIFWPELSAAFGGPLPSDESQKGMSVSRYPLYPVKFAMAGDGNIIAPFPFVARGAVKLPGKPESVVKLLIKRGISIIQQESGL